MGKKVGFKYTETKESILAQFKQNRLFCPLLDYLHEADIDLLSQTPQEQQLTVAELKALLRYDEVLDESLVSLQDGVVLADLLRDSESVLLKLPCIIKLNKKNIKKLLRIDKYYNNSTYLFKKLSGATILKNEHFFLPFLQTNTLLAMLRAFPDTQEVSVGIMDNVDSLLSVKAMLAINKKIKEKPNIQPKSVTLIMSEECNLRCTYCYEPAKKRDKTVLTFETAKQVLRKFDRDSLVTFFGGEPMLHIELMKKICEWGWEYRNFKFAMITNGQIVDRSFFQDYAKYFSFVQLSCDGSEAAHDINRGHGAFKRTMEFYRVFQETTGKYPTLHAVLGKYSIPYLLDTVRWYYEMEKDLPEAQASFRWLPGDANIWDERDFALYAEQLGLVKEWYLNNNIRNTKFAIRAFAQAEQNLLGLGTQQQSALRGNASLCSAGSALMAVLPTGLIVPCHHEYWCAKEERIYEEIDLNDDISGINHMSELCVKDIPECNSCPQWGCCVCPGAFYFLSKSYTTPDKNWCRAGKMLIETAKSYVEELAQKLHDEQHKVDYLAAGLDYLLQEKVNIE
jgi:uncharacterized protein